MKVGYDKVGSQMNIASTTGAKSTGVRPSKSGATDAAESVQSNTAGEASAKVNFSEQAQRINKIKELATPDMDSIREDKVAHFQKMIDEGNYSVDAAAVADRLVDEHLTF